MKTDRWSCSDYSLCVVCRRNNISSDLCVGNDVLRIRSSVQDCVRRRNPPHGSVEMLQILSTKSNFRLQRRLRGLCASLQKVVTRQNTSQQRQILLVGIVERT